MKSNVYLPAAVTLIVLLTGCQGSMENDHKARAKEEILKAEKAFEAMVREKGIREAFLFYADTNAAILRGEELIAGKDAIRDWYNSRPATNMQLSWSPDYVDASAAGDMGYTYGRYTFTVSDSAGFSREGKGVFHTVWKRQKDGSWKFVWD